MSDKKFTWADLKEICNETPEENLSSEVILWAEDETVHRITEVEILEEDYVYDGDEGCGPKSVLMEAMGEDFDEEENYLVHKKGTRILNDGPIK